MNICCVTAKLAEAPQEVYVSANSTAIRCKIILPPATQGKEPTHLEYNSYGRDSERFRNLAKGTVVYIHRAKLRFDVDSRTFSLHGGTSVAVGETFPIFNTVILSGRCVKDIDQADARAFKTTADGLMICNQTLSVSTGRQQADLFNFYAINKAEDRLNLAELLVNATRKGTGLTIEGVLITDGWIDKETKERRSLTKIKINGMTLPPKMGDAQQSKPVTTQTTVASEGNVSSLWGSRVADEPVDPWTITSGGLPDLPGQYNGSPELEEVPF